MSSSYEQEWTRRWTDRAKQIMHLMGHKSVPHVVSAFSWQNKILPGACAVYLAPSNLIPIGSYLTLGPSQPLDKASEGSGFELLIHAAYNQTWPQGLLYGLIECWLDDESSISTGYWFPTIIYKSRDKRIVGHIGSDDRIQHTGLIRWVYLWPDPWVSSIIVDGRSVRIYCVVGATANEHRLIDELSPPHLLLLLAQYSMCWLFDIDRQCVTSVPGWDREWNKIRLLTHDQCVNELNQCRY